MHLNLNYYKILEDRPRFYCEVVTHLILHIIYILVRYGKIELIAGICGFKGILSVFCSVLPDGN